MNSFFLNLIVFREFKIKHIIDHNGFRSSRTVPWKVWTGSRGASPTTNPTLPLASLTITTLPRPRSVVDEVFAKRKNGGLWVGHPASSSTTSAWRSAPLNTDLVKCLTLLSYTQKRKTFCLTTYPYKFDPKPNCSKTSRPWDSILNCITYYI